jgi:hypothetical protein
MNQKNADQVIIILFFYVSFCLAVSSSESAEYPTL